MTFDEIEEQEDQEVEENLWDRCVMEYDGDTPLDDDYDPFDDDDLESRYDNDEV